jgi:hypothetical protein
MKQPGKRYTEDHILMNMGKLDHAFCENNCGNCILFRHPDDGNMTCKILLKSFEQEFYRAVKSLNNDYIREDGYGYDESGFYSWMDLLALVAQQKRFTELHGCSMFKEIPK